MNTSVLTNPAPSNGYNAVLGAMAAQAAPAEGSLAGFNPSVQNRVKQTFVNPVATYPFLVKPWRDRWELGFHTGDLMFIFSSGKTVNASSKMVVLANLPTLNHIMASEFGNDAENAQYTVKENWTYIGVMRNSAVASNQIGGGSQRNSKPRGGNQRAAERILNIDVRGSTRMFNYWEHAAPGMRLHLVWRQVSMGSGRLTNPNDSKRNAVHAGSWGIVNGEAQYFDTTGASVGPRYSRAEYNELPGTAPEESDRKASVDPFAAVWQLLPYSGRPGEYTQDPIWWNNQMIASPQMHRPITVGFVFQGIGVGERSDHSVAIRKATQLSEDRFKLPMVHCFVRV